jgi:MoxR-like ATPase
VSDPIRIEEIQEKYGIIRQELGKVIVGQEKVINEMLVALFSGGHVLLEGVPGLAKTLLISSLAGVMDLDFKRIQFTPDLMPSDITGSEILEEDHGTGHRAFKFIKGPIFTNMLLADEINRTPPKTQAALLQAMQEGQVTAGGRTLDLGTPFFVMATQNPIEQEGTYPLPEAQLDRFMFNILIDYPSAEEEVAIVQRTTRDSSFKLEQILNGNDVLGIQEVIRRWDEIGTDAVNYAVNLVRATRVGSDDEVPTAKKYLDWGAGPRAAQFLIMGAKTQALLNGAPAVKISDIRDMAYPVLRHRLVANFAASRDGMSKDAIIESIIGEVDNRSSH